MLFETNMPVWMVDFVILVIFLYIMVGAVEGGILLLTDVTKTARWAIKRRWRRRKNV